MEEKKEPGKERRKGRHRIGRALVGLINGSFLTKDDALRHLPYFLFLALLALLYIANGYYAEGTVRDINRLQNELKELRSEYITTKSDLMYRSKQSQVADRLSGHGFDLRESMTPPGKIVVRKNMSPY